MVILLGTNLLVSLWRFLLPLSFVTGAFCSPRNAKMGGGTAFVNHDTRRQRHRPPFSTMASLNSADPRLIVLDLDNTVWTPELYQLRKHQRAGTVPTARRDVKMFPGAEALFAAARSGDFPNTKFAVASRTNKVDWAHDLLSQFELLDLIDFVEIFPGSKEQHFRRLQRDSGIKFSEMLFFDDARDGRYGNCEPVANLGVFSAHCPGGLTSYNIIDTALQRFQEWNRQPGYIVEWDGSVTNSATATSSRCTGRLEGEVKMVNSEKRYGFIRINGKPDVFFHFNDLKAVTSVRQGTTLSFVCERDLKNGKTKAADIEITRQKSSSINSSSTENDKATVQLQCFSMNMPFAALLANGYKTLETRNNEMFVPYPAGTKMLLHVGRRNYPDGDRHMAVMKSGGLSEEKIGMLKRLRSGFGKGMAVAIVELGKTYKTSVEERSDPEVQRKVAAFGADSGKMVTEIKRVAYLKKPIKVSGQGGVFEIDVDPAILPDGWKIVKEEKYRVDNKKVNRIKEKSSKNSREDNCESGGRKPMYSISG